MAEINLTQLLQPAVFIDGNRELFNGFQRFDLQALSEIGSD